MKISVITVCRNAAATISDTLRSVASQTYGEVEHIVVDGASTDGTVAILEKQLIGRGRWLSEPDQGIYDAMNKGVGLASGEAIGFLNADDLFAAPDTLERVAACLADPGVEACFGDLVIVDPRNLERIVRYFRGNDFTPERLAAGCMPPHPTLYVKRRVFDQHGLFQTDYRIAADFEFVARLFGKAKVPYRYIPRVLVRMRLGGVSTSGLRSTLILNREILRACRENGISTNLVRIYMKYGTKVLQLFRRPSAAAGTGEI